MKKIILVCVLAGVLLSGCLTINYHGAGTYLRPYGTVNSTLDVSIDLNPYN